MYEIMPRWHGRPDWMSCPESPQQYQLIISATSASILAIGVSVGLVVVADSISLWSTIDGP